MYVNRIDCWKMNGKSFYEASELRIESLRIDKFKISPSYFSVGDLLKKFPELAMVLLSFGHQIKNGQTRNITELNSVIFSDNFLHNAYEFPGYSLQLFYMSKQLWDAYVWHTQEGKVEYIGYHFPKDKNQEFIYKNMFGEKIVKTPDYKGLELYNSSNNGLPSWIDLIRKNGIIKPQNHIL